MSKARILNADVRTALASLPDQSIQTVVTSPPYWGLRDYGALGQLGQEDSPYEFVENLVEIFRDIKRVLKDDGTVWLNLGDTYVGTGHKKDAVDPKYVDGRNGQKTALNNKVDGLKSKDLIGIPWRVALALQDDGWYLRSDIIWNKPNVMPEAVKDRPTKSHEYIFLLTKSPKYFYDYVAIREEGVIKAGTKGAKGSVERSTTNKVNSRPPEYKVYDGMRNKRDVWTVRTKPYTGAHFAVYPTELIDPCILAGTSEHGNCADCGVAWVRETKNERIARNQLDPADIRYRPNNYDGAYADINGKGDAGYTQVVTVGWKQQCACETTNVVPATVLDPFSGSGTTGVVSLLKGRDYIGIELNPEYAKLSENRIEQEVGLFGSVIVEVL
jgi:DNA modification methylase